MEPLVYVERYCDDDRNSYPGSRRSSSVSAPRWESGASTSSGGRFRGSQHVNRSDTWQEDLRQYSLRCREELVYEEQYFSDTVDRARRTRDRWTGDQYQYIDLSLFSRIHFDAVDHCCQNEIPQLDHRLKEIIRNFAKCEKCYKEFVERYPGWNGSRRKSMQHIKKITEILQNTRKGCNVAKVTSLSAATAGGVMAVVGAALTPFTFGASSALVISGLSLSTVGGSATFTAALTETILERGNVKAAIELLKQDKEEFQRLSKWLKHTTDFVDSINEVMDFEVFARLVADFKKLASIFNEPSESIKLSAYTNFVSDIAQSTKSGKVSILQFIISIGKNAKVIKLFKELVRMHHDNPIVFESTTMFARICVQALKYTEFGADAILASTLTASAELGLTTATKVSAAAGRALVQGLLASAGLAIDLLSLVLTSIDLHNGSKCPSAEKLLKMHKTLSDEFDAVKLFYSELLKCIRN